MARACISGDRQPSDRDDPSIFPLFLKDSAIDWYDTLAADLKTDYDQLATNFKSHFGKSALDHVFADGTVFTRVHRQKARDYIAHMQKLAKRVPHPQDEKHISRLRRGMGRLRYELRRALRRRCENSRVAEHSSGSSTVAAILAKLTDAEADLAAAQLEECDF